MSYNNYHSGGSSTPPNDQFNSQYSLSSNQQTHETTVNMNPSPYYQNYMDNQAPPPAYPAAVANTGNSYMNQQQYSNQQYPGQNQHFGSSMSQVGADSARYFSNNNNNDDESRDVESLNEEGTTIFDDVKVRHRFIRKVYFIVLLQLLATFGWMAVVVFVNPVNQFMINNSYLIWVGTGVSLASLIPLLCCELHRVFPINILLLIAFTAGESLCLGTVSAFYNVDEILIAFGITCGLTFALTVFAMQTKWDFTGIGPYLFGVIIVLFIFGILCIIFRSRILSIVYSSVGALVFCIYIIYDTQLICGDKKRAFSPDDFIAAAITLYLDIIQLFLMLLQLIGLTSDN